MTNVINKKEFNDAAKNLVVLHLNNLEEHQVKPENILILWSNDDTAFLVNTLDSISFFKVTYSVFLKCYFFETYSMASNQIYDLEMNLEEKGEQLRGCPVGKKGKNGINKSISPEIWDKVLDDYLKS